MGLGDAGWDCLLTEPDSAVYRPRRRRGAVNSATPSRRPALASWEGHGCAQWLRQLTAWARSCSSETVNPPSKVRKSLPLALVDLCGLELITDWEPERTQPFPCGHHSRSRQNWHRERLAVNMGCPGLGSTSFGIPWSWMGPQPSHYRPGHTQLLS